MKRAIKTMMIAALLPIMSSCEKELNPEYHVIAPLPVIQGVYSQDGPSVLLTYTTPMEDAMDNTPDTEATVVIEDVTDLMQPALQLAPDETGWFVCPDAPAPVPGHDYRITVTRKDGVFVSTAEMMPPAKILGHRWTWVKMPYDYVAVLQIAVAKDADVDENFWVKVYRNGKLYEWTYAYGVYATDGMLPFNITTTRMDTEAAGDDDKNLYDGDVLDVEVMSVDRTLCDWFRSIVNAQNSNGNQLFEGPYTLGYFLPAHITRTSIVFHPDEITDKI